MTRQKTNISHDHNIKNLLIDFPEDTLEFVFPEALSEWGAIKKITFVRQEPKKHHLSDANLVLDMPILFEFHNKSLLLWLVEFQEDKEKFSIYKLMRYTTDLMELHPEAVVVPAVLFTDRKKWRIDVLRRLESRMKQRTFVHFEYIFCKLFDYHALDYYNVNNPVVKILLPKMKYDPSRRSEVIRKAYIGLHQLVSSGLFEKYIYFIDTYAKVTFKEQKILCQELMASEETAMLADYIKDIGRKEGREEGKKEGEIMGRILLFHEISGLSVPSRDELKEMTFEALKAVLEEVEQQWMIVRSEL